MNGSWGLVGTRPSSGKGVGHALRLPTFAPVSRREGRPIPVNRSNVRLAVSLAYMMSSSGGLAVTLRGTLSGDTFPGARRLLPIHAVQQRVHQIDHVVLLLLGLGD